ncbi:MAG: DUF4386 domain-containing protein [Promethearchaeota archaeon]
MNENQQNEKKSEKNEFILLGIAFLAVFILSILFAMTLSAVTGSQFEEHQISEILVNIELNSSLMRLAILLEVLNSVCIVFLAVMLYTIFKKENKILSLIAFGWWILEVAILCVMVIGLYGLIPLSEQYLEAGTPENSHFLTLAHFLYYGVYDYGFILHNVFFAMGGMLWYYQFYKSNAVPKVLALWGLISITLFTVYIFIRLYSPEIPLSILLLAPYIPFELVIGSWFIYKGVKSK